MNEQYTFHWLNESKIRKEGDAWILYAPKETDFFCNNGSVSEEGASPVSLCNAPFYHTEIAGDFVLRVKVQHAFQDTYDSSSLMVMTDMQNWAKSCLEMTDFGTHAVVSVVTRNGESDDANGCNISGDSVWLQIARVGNSYAFHYSADGKQFYMSRFFNLPRQSAVKVGLLPQAPVGSGGERKYEHLTIERRTVKNIRFGE